MNFIWKQCLLSATIIFGASTVQAATVTATYTGTVASGFSDTDFFGVGQSLVRNAYTAVFTYDTSIGVNAQPNYDEVYGGPDLALLLGHATPGHEVSPILSAVLTIGSISYNFGANLYGQTTMADNVSGNFVYNYAGSILGGAHLGLHESHDDGTILVDIAASQELDGYGIPSWVFGNGSQGEFLLDDGTSGTLNVAHVSIVPTAAVPLPASLPFLGLALAGLVAVRRRRPSV